MSILDPYNQSLKFGIDNNHIEVVLIYRFQQGVVKLVKPVIKLNEVWLSTVFSKLN